MDIARTYNLKTGVFTRRQIQSIISTTKTLSTIATCLHGTHGIALIQHPDEVCYITSRIRMGTSNWTVPTIPLLYLLLLPDMTTIALLHLAINMPKSIQSVNNFCMRAAYIYMPRVLFGFTGEPHDWNLAFVLATRIMVIDVSKVWSNDPFCQFWGKGLVVLMCYWAFLNVLLQLCVLDSSRCHRFPQIEEA